MPIRKSRCLEDAEETPARRRRASRVRVVALVGVLVLAVALALPELAARYLERTLPSALHQFGARPIEWDSLDVQWWPTPALSLRGVEVPATTSGQPPLLRAGTVDATVDLLALRSGTLRLARVRVEDVELTFEPTSAGVPAPGHDTGAREPPWDGTLEFAGRRFVVDVRDLGIDGMSVGRGSGTDRLRVERLRASGGTRVGIRLRAEGSWKLLPLKVDSRLGTLEQLLSGPRSSLAVDLDLGTAAAHVEGELLGTRDQRSVDLDVTLQAPWTEEAPWIADFDVPALGPFEARGRVRAGGGKIALEELAGSIGASRFSGDLTFTAGGGEPVPGMAPRRSTLRTRLVFDVFDVRPFAPRAPWKRKVKEVVVRTSAVELAVFQKRLENLEIDADLELRSILAEMPDLRDWRFTFGNGDGAASLQFHATSGHTHGSGTVRLEDRDDAPVLQLEVLAQPLELSDLLPPGVGSGGTEASFASARLEATSRGATLREMIDQAILTLSAESGSARFGRGASPVEIELDSIRATGPASGELHTEAALRHEAGPMAITFDGPGPLRWSRDEVLPWSFDARGLGGRAIGSGSVTPLGAAPELTFALEAEVESVARWSTLWRLEPLARLDVPLSVRMRGAAARGGQSLVLDRLELGNSSVHGSAERDATNGDPAWSFLLAAEQIDLDELRKIGSPPPEARDETALPLLDRPLPAERLSVLPRVKGSVAIARVLGLDCPIAEVEATLDASNGTLRANDVEIQACGAMLSADLLLDAAAKTGDLGAELDFVVNGVRSAELPLETVMSEDLAERLEITLQRAGGRAAARGSSLREWLESLDADVSLENAETNYRFDDRPPIHAALTSARVVHDDETGWNARATGVAGEIPVELRLELGIPGASSTADGAGAPFALTLAGESANLSASGRLAGESGGPGGEVDVALELANLATLGDIIAGLELPASEPLTFEAHLSRNGDRLDVSGLRLATGESVVSGTVGLSRDQDDRLRVDVALESPHLRIEDFLPTEPIWHAERDGSEAEAVSAEETPKERTSRAAWLSRADGSLDFRFRDATFREDRIGRGEISATLENGKLSVEALRLDLAERRAGELRFALEDSSQGVAYDVEASFTDLDYGPLLQKLYADAPSGRLSVDLKLAGKAARLDELATATSGRVNLLISPDHLDTELLELWGASLASAVFRGFQLGQHPSLNCAVLRVELEDGVATANTIVLDSTNNRIAGSGRADFGQKHFEIELAPRAKRASVLTVSTPLRISGWYDDFQVRPALGRTVQRFFKVRQWLQSRGLWGGGLPLDGSDVCTAESLRNPPPDRKKERSLGKLDRHGARKTPRAVSSEPGSASPPGTR